MKKLLFRDRAVIKSFILLITIVIFSSSSHAADKVRISVSSLDVAFLTAAGTGY